MKIEEDKHIKKIALLVSCASILQITESLLPHPVPGVRLGLANIITLVTLVNIGFGAALQVVIFRTIISSFILGTFLSPSFILSFSGGLVSTLVMALFYKLSTLNRKPYLSIIGISLLGAASHNIVQIILFYLLLIKHKGIFLLLPWLGISAVIMGWITGLVASLVCQRLENSSIKGTLGDCKNIKAPYFEPASYVHRNSLVHISPPEVKIVCLIILALVIFFSNNLIVYTIIFLSLFSIILISRISLPILVSKLGNLSFIILFSFFTPLFFNANGKILSQIGSLIITQDGLYMGTCFAFRITLLTLGASILAQTTSPEALSTGLRKLLFPLKIFGVSAQKAAATMMLSWTSIPINWKRVRYMIQNKKPVDKKLKKLIPIISDIIVALYLQANNEQNLDEILLERR